jgi:hypothetical protein
VLGSPSKYGMLGIIEESVGRDFNIIGTSIE